jgi:hypothetical protein
VSTPEQLAAVGVWQRDQCHALGAPTWVAVIDAIVADLDRDRHTSATELLCADPGDPVTTNVWLRILGAVHRLVLDDPTGPLAACLPTAGGIADPPAAVAAFGVYVEGHRDAIAHEMGSPVQTNEVGRAAALSASMRWLGGDLHLREVGASAGLNLWLDRYRVVADRVSWGPPGSPLVLNGSFASGVPSGAPFAVLTRRGCDRMPLDPTSEADRRVLRSFVWPDHVDRLARLDTALALADPVTIDAQDGVTWSREQLRRLPRGRTVLFHSIVLPYFDSSAREQLTCEVHAAGEGATASESLACVSFELAADLGDAELVVARWPERDVHRLARLSPHGDRIRWDVQPVEA